MKRAILLSGGVDSSTIAFMERPQLAIVIDYGQMPAIGEWRAARAIAKRLNIPLETIEIDCSSLGSGDMAGTSASPYAPVPEWWPYRNQLLVTLAAPVALKLGIRELLIGTVSTDGQHADGTPEFIEALNQLMMIQEGGIRVVAPSLGRTSVELVQDSGIPLSLLAWTHSCHVASLACGQCRGCVKRSGIFKEIGFGPH